MTLAEQAAIKVVHGALSITATLPLSALTRNLQQNVVLFDRLPAEWQHVAALAPQQILSVLQDDGTFLGLVQITPPGLKKGHTWGHEWPREIFKHGNLWDAIRTGVNHAPDPEVGGGTGVVTYRWLIPT